MATRRPAELQRQHRIAFDIIPEGGWMRLYVKGLSPEQAVSADEIPEDGRARAGRMRPSLILRRIQSYWPDWRSPDDYTVHVDGEDQSVGRIFWRYAAHPEGLPWTRRSSFISARGAPRRTRGTRPISTPRWRPSGTAGTAGLPSWARSYSSSVPAMHVSRLHKRVDGV